MKESISNYFIPKNIFFFLSFFTTLSIVFFLFSSCIQSNQSIKTISNAELEKLLRSGAFLVDVRNPDEFATGSVEGAVNIPKYQIEENLELFKGKETIILFCKAGIRSESVVLLLKEKGFINVYNGGGLERVAKFLKKIK